jgi:putative flippase GtrA
VLANLIARPIGPLSPFAAHVTAFLCSMFVSYAGHHAFTFRLSGRHKVYFSRFTIITATLFTLSTVLAYIADRDFHLPAAVITVTIAILYPAASYVIHSIWTFAARGRVMLD